MVLARLRFIFDEVSQTPIIESSYSGAFVAGNGGILIAQPHRFY